MLVLLEVLHEAINAKHLAKYWHTVMYSININDHMYVRTKLFYIFWHMFRNPLWEKVGSEENSCCN